VAGEKRLRPGAKPRNKNKKQTTPELEAKEEENEVREEKTEDTASTDTPAELPEVNLLVNKKYQLTKTYQYERVKKIL